MYYGLWRDCWSIQLYPGVSLHHINRRLLHSREHIYQPDQSVFGNRFRERELRLLGYLVGNGWNNNFRRYVYAFRDGICNHHRDIHSSLHHLRRCNSDSGISDPIDCGYRMRQFDDRRGSHC